MKSKTNIEVLVFLTILICLALAILGFSVSKVDSREYYEPVSVSEPTDPCLLKDVYCEKEPISSRHEIGQKIIYAQVTAYTKAETCPFQSCITASNRPAKSGVSAACPRNIRLGTEINVGGTQWTCDDRTHQRYDGRFDLYFGETEQDYREALAWGVKVLPVTILE